MKSRKTHAQSLLIASVVLGGLVALATNVAVAGDAAAGLTAQADASESNEAEEADASDTPKLHDGAETPNGDIVPRDARTEAGSPDAGSDAQSAESKADRAGSEESVGAVDSEKAAEPMKDAAADEHSDTPDEADSASEDSATEAPSSTDSEESGSGGESSAAQNVVPPELVQSVEAEYPERAWDEELEADVYMRIDISAEGEVVQVEPTSLAYFSYDEEGYLQEESGDVEVDEYGFVSAAEEAIRQYQFEPARLRSEESPDGQPIPVRVDWKIGFVYDYEETQREATEEDFESDDGATGEGEELEEPSASETTETPDSGADGAEVEDSGSERAEEGPVFDMDPDDPVNFEGKVVERGTREDVRGVELQLFREPDGPRLDLITAADGTFEARGLPAGEWYVLIDDVEYEVFEATEEISRTEVTEVVYRIERVSYGDYRSVTYGDRPEREVTRRTLQITEVQRIPGNNNDAIRVVQNLPGVARASFGGGQIIVRGSEPDDSAFFIDGMPIPALYHFGALRAVIPSEFLESIDFYPGNFGARFGRATAGVLEVTTKEDHIDEFGGHVDINLFDAGFYFEGPINDKLSFQLAARRSYIDGVLAAVSDIVPLNFTVAPRYYDYQAKLLWEINNNHSASIMFFGSDDLLDFVLEEEEGLEPGLRGGVRASTSFHDALLRIDSRFNDKVSNEFRMLAGFQKLGFSVGEDLFLNLKLRNLAWRDELTVKIADNLTSRFGLDIQLNPGSINVSLPRPPTEGEEPAGFGAQDVIESEQSFSLYAPAIYTAWDYRPIEDLQILPGLRLDYFRQTGDWAVDGRLGIRYSISDLVTVKGAVGNYHRPPSPQETGDEFGNPDLNLEYAIQYSAGAEFQFTDYLSLDVVGFYKDLRNLASRSDDVTVNEEGESVPLVYDNEGRGRVYGAEIFLRHQLANNFFGWISYTLSRSERRDSGESDYRLFDSDQTHILTVLGSYYLPKEWSIGAKFRLISGNPTTPIVGGTFDSNANSYVRATGRANSIRQGTFHQLDIRVDKRWIFDRWTLNTYLDLQNVYNRQNAETRQYNYDFTESVTVSGLPFIPSIGIRAEF
jgi:hypothetical protein